MLTRALVATTLVSVGALATSATTTKPTTSCKLASSVSWQSCSIFGYNDTSDAIKPQCAYYTVPIDYHNCAAGTVNLAVVKRPATVKPKLGTIFVNPGGPGGSGTSYVLTDHPELSNTTGGQHDIVSFDPRAVGHTSLQISCFSSTEQQAQYFQPDSILSYGPQQKGNFTNAKDDDPDELALWAKLNQNDSYLKSIAADCLANNGKNLTYIGSVATVRDFLALSDVIDGPGKPINYWGVSYGTIIGSYLVNMFPERVGKVIIDGVLNPIWWSQEPQYLSWSKSISTVTLAFNEFTRACAEAGPTYCAIATANSTQADIAAWFQNFIDVAHDHSVGPLTSSLVRAQIHGVLYQANAWGPAAQQLKQIYGSLVGGGAGTNGTAPSSIKSRSGSSQTDSQLARVIRNPFGPLVPNQRNINGLTQKRADAPQFAFSSPTIAIACSDGIDTPNVTTKDVFGELILAAKTSSQLIGPEWFATQYCASWPVRAVERFQGPWNRKLANKILVIGNVGDVITPLSSAKQVAGLLGDSAVLLTRDGYGHTSLSEESICTNNVIANYFVHGKLPAKGTVCATNKNYFNSPKVSSNSSASWIARS